jgi:hypothetical protein
MKNKIEKLKPFIPPIVLNNILLMKSLLSFKKYKKLLLNNSKYKDLHKGKRCFILGSGPSIKEQNLKPLKNEITFALNNFYVHPDFKHITESNVDKYYLVAPVHPPQTDDEWTKWFVDMDNNLPKEMVKIFGLSDYSNNIKDLIDKVQLFKDQEIIWYYTGIQVNEYYRFKEANISLDKMIWTADTVSIYALITAIYMGFKEIYFLGMDHNYFLYDNESEMRMYSRSIHQNNEFERAFKGTFYTMEYLRQYRIFRCYEILRDNTNAAIYNATKGGLLKVFPRINYNELIEKL